MKHTITFFAFVCLVLTLSASADTTIVGDLVQYYRANGNDDTLDALGTKTWSFTTTPGSTSNPVEVFQQAIAGVSLDGNSSTRLARIDTSQSWVIENNGQESGVLFFSAKMTATINGNPVGPNKLRTRFRNSTTSAFRNSFIANGSLFSRLKAIDFDNIIIHSIVNAAVEIKLTLSLEGLTPQKWRQAKYLELHRWNASIGASWSEAAQHCENNNRQLPREQHWIGAFQLLQGTGDIHGARIAGTLATWDNWKTWHDNRTGGEGPIAADQGYHQGPFYHLLGNVAEWVQAEGVVVARSTDALYDQGLEPNVDILRVAGQEIANPEDFWAKVGQQEGSVELTIRPRTSDGNGTEQTIAVTGLNAPDLLVTERLLKGGSWYDPDQMLSPYARSLVVYQPYIENFWDKHLLETTAIQKSLAKIRALKTQGFAITVWSHGKKTGFRRAYK